MATVSMHKKEIPSQVVSFVNSYDRFPGLLTEGESLLGTIAHVTALIRANSAIITKLSSLNSNGDFAGKYQEKLKDLSTKTEALFIYPEATTAEGSRCSVTDKVNAFNQTLSEELDKLEIAIRNCSSVKPTFSGEVSKETLEEYNEAHKDVLPSLKETSMKVYTYCQTVLPTLHVYRATGQILQTRLKVVMTQTMKGYALAESEAHTLTTPILHPEQTSGSIFNLAHLGSFIPSLWGSTPAEEAKEPNQGCESEPEDLSSTKPPLSSEDALRAQLEALQAQLAAISAKPTPASDDAGGESGDSEKKNLDNV